MFASVQTVILELIAILVCNFNIILQRKNLGDLPRSCEEWQFLRNVRGRIPKGRNVTIDLDGGGPLPGFQVVCRTEKDDLGTDVVS